MTNKPIRYLSYTLLVIAGIHAAVGYFNYLVDPLWFFGGNKLQDRNFPFDERMSRLAHFVKSDRDFDCYIFGASRVAMMNHHTFSDYNCFMVSFANGTPRELLAYARFIDERALVEPRLVIVGVDDFAFLSPMLTDNLPEQIVDNREPHFWEYYFSGDVTRWSIDTLLNLTPKPRYYGKDLTGQIHERASEMGILEGDSAARDTLNRDTVARYSQFEEIFPEARHVGYATPVEASRIRGYHDADVLHVYLQALHEVSTHFDVMYDFSIPSEITADPTLTYDGSHYEPRVNDRIVNAIENHVPEFGIILTGKTPHEISRQYAERLRRFSE